MIKDTLTPSKPADAREERPSVSGTRGFEDTTHAAAVQGFKRLPNGLTQETTTGR